MRTVDSPEPTISLIPASAARITPRDTAPAFAASGQRVNDQRDSATGRSMPGWVAASLMPGVAIELAVRASTRSSLEPARDRCELLGLHERRVDECLQRALDRAAAEPIENAFHC